MHGLNEYDFSARWQDAAVPGFTTPDPLAELNCGVSPYVYCDGDPINRVDPTGMVPTMLGVVEVVGYRNINNAYMYLWTHSQGQNNNSDTRTIGEQLMGTGEPVYSAAPSQSALGERELGKLQNNSTTRNSAMGMIKNIASSAQKWVKKNKSELLGMAKSLQTTGNATAKAGLLCAAVGAPVAGVGATPGMALFLAGGCLSTIGAATESIINFTTGDTTAGIEAATGITIDLATDHAFPGATRGILGVQSGVITSGVSEATSTSISSTDALDNYIFQINQ
jgi:hypothetical protein